MAIENHPSVRQLVARTLDAPADALEAVPALLDALDHGDPVVRVGVAWAICAVAAEHSDDAGAIAGQLDGRHGHTASMAAGWIRRELDVDGVSSASTDRGRPSGTSTEEADGEAATAGGPRGAGTARPDPESGRDEGEPDEPAAETGGGPPAPPDRADASDEGGSDESDSGDDQATDTARPPSGGPTPERPDRVVRNGQFTIELDRTSLDSLEIVERVATDRHSWTYAGIASVDARRHAVLVRTFRPPPGARLSSFAAAFEDAATEWAGVGDHESVLSVYDFGRRPHPWVVTGYAPKTLRSVGRLPVPAAFRVGLDAATALGHAHERGVTHRSIDPRSLALDSEDGAPVGRLTNFGIVDVFRAVDGPLPLDSRYAAPELFDADHGGVDWLTDVYHLGAVLYTAFTGRPPYEDSLVARGGPVGLSYVPPSSVVDGVPVAADRIVAKAMATHKIARYESADEFARDIQSALEEVEDGT